MSSWAERVHRRAADFSNVVTSCGHPGSSAPTYPYRLEKVKFGVPLEEVCKNDNIPGPLLVLILKLNKESPNRRDVFRAPGHQGAMKKLIHFLQAGRLVNVDNYSVYTIASVLKKFLRKIPNGIFGRSGEEELFAIIELSNESEQIERLHKLIQSLPKYTQHLLVLLFGTFRVIASNAAHAGTGMTSEALGVSVAPSFFQSCVSDGKTARMEDVLKFKVATKIMKHIIDKFATDDLFGRENYEYYARVTGRILKVQDEWICSFQYPPPPRGKQAQQKYALQHSLEAEKTWLQCQCERWGLLAQEESRSTPALLTSSSSALDNSVVSLGVTPEHSFMESCARLSVSLEGPGLFAMTSSPLPTRKPDMNTEDDDDDLDEDDYNNDDEDDDQEGADDEEDNDHHNQHHFNQHLQHQQQQQHFFTQHSTATAADDDEDFAAELDLSNGSAAGNNENIENQSYKANFRTCQSMAHTTTTATKFKTRSSGSSNEHSGVSNPGGTADNNTFTDSPDDIDDEMTSVVKRRYKQNKKKTTTNNATAQLRRFRTNSTAATTTTPTSATATAANANTTISKSFETKNCDFLTNDYEYIAKPKTQTIDSNQQKSRVCSRCKRGIRHSSSCSSSTTSGGGAGAGAAANGSVMTMEELRAVNRYAESTKSLSYLPQVHERQTARMRTRSEWFLGPKDGDLLCVPPNTCSNCCLTAGNYLGGGSTRDMRRMIDHHQLHTALQQPAHTTTAALNQQQQHPQHVTEAVNTSLYLFYKQRQQQLQQQQHHYQPLPMQRQSFHLSPEHMDTDETFSSSFATAGNSNSLNLQQMNLHSMQQQLSAIQHQQQHQQQQQPQTPLQFNNRQAQEGQGLFLDTNYGRYDFDDKDILITTTNDKNLKSNYNNNNNKENNNNNNNSNNINNDGYTISNRQHLMKTTTPTTSHDMTLQNNTLRPTSTHTQLSPSSSPLATKTTSVSSLSLYHLHDSYSNNNNNNKNNNNNRSKIHQLHNSQYYSTESLLNKHDIDDDHIVERQEYDTSDQDNKPSCSYNSINNSKLSYQSYRLLPKQQLQQQQERKHEECKHQQQQSINHSHHQHDNNSIILNSSFNTNNKAQHSTATTNTLFMPLSCSNDNDEVDNIELSHDMQEIDYIVPSHYRHSTPMLQRRRLRQQQQALRRQRLPSTSSSLYQSFNASLQAPMLSSSSAAISASAAAVAAVNNLNSSYNRFTAGPNSSLNSVSNYESQSTLTTTTTTTTTSSSGGGSGGGDNGGIGGSSSAGNSNFVSIIFNVLDFLF